MPEVEGSPIGELVAQSYVPLSNLCILKMPLGSLISGNATNAGPDAAQGHFSKCKTTLELKN